VAKKDESSKKSNLPQFRLPVSLVEEGTADYLLHLAGQR